MSFALNRRELLLRGVPAFAGAMAGIPLLSRLLPAEDKPQRRVDVLVIGAGAAGLAAARELTRQKLDVLILEARERIGGRIWSERFWNLTLDLGASWIHGIRGNPIHKLARELGLKMHPTRSEKHWLYRDGPHEYGDAEQDATEARLKKLLEKVRVARKRSLEQGDRDIPLQTALDRALGDQRLTPLQRRELNFQISSLIEQEYAADVEELSAHYWEDSGEFPGGDVLFPQGYGQIARHLAEGQKIKLGQQVRRIEWNETKGVVVETTRDRFEADAAVVTLPLGVLKRGSVTFEPALPLAKREAIGRVGMGLLNKTYLRFPRQFWPAKADWLGYVGEPRGRWSEYINAAAFTGQPVLLGFNAATYARRLEKKTDEETIADMVAALRSMFGRRVPDPTDARITRWASDEFSFGSYSYMKTGATPDDYDRLAEPVGRRLFFAGEHTSRRHPATVHGAYMSGLQSAKLIAARK